MVDNLRDFRPNQLLVGGGKIVKIAKVSVPKRDAPWYANGEFVIDNVSLRTVPPGFTGGELSIDNYGNLNVCKLAHGNVDKYHAWLEKTNWHVDLSLVAVGEADPIIQLIPEKLLKFHKFTKSDLIAYVVKVHGVIGRDDIMRMVAALEGLPWIPTSNSDYFGTTKNNSLVGTVLLEAGKRGRRNVYRLGPPGEERAKRVMTIVGEAPALAAK